MSDSAPLGTGSTVERAALDRQVGVRFPGPQPTSQEARSLTSWQDFGLGSRAEVMLVETRRLHPGGTRTRSRVAGRSIPLLFVHDSSGWPPAFVTGSWLAVPTPPSGGVTYCDLAQVAERSAVNGRVPGSIPGVTAIDDSHEPGFVCRVVEARCIGVGSSPKLVAR